MAVGTLSADDPPDSAAFRGLVSLFGVLDATDPTDVGEFAGKAFDPTNDGFLDATDDPDEAEFKGRAWPGERCRGKTVCFTAAQAKAPELVGTMRDRDTDTCRNWDNVIPFPPPPSGPVKTKQPLAMPEPGQSAAVQVGNIGDVKVGELVWIEPLGYFEVEKIA